jgi:hypothetical protein
MLDHFMCVLPGEHTGSRSYIKLNWSGSADHQGATFPGKPTHDDPSHVHLFPTLVPY